MNNPLKNILIIPSWYPTKEKEHLGIFFKEQAILMAENFNIHVLVGKEVLIGRKQYLKDCIKFKKIETTVTLIAHNEHYREYQFNYPLYCFKSKQYQQQQRIVGYKIALQQIDLHPDLIHAQSNIMGGIIATGLANKLAYKVLITEHLPLILNNFDYTLKDTYFKALNSADCVSTVSENSRAILIDNLMTKEVVNHGNFIDENIFTLKEARSESLFHIAWVGSLYFRKDPLTFIRVIKEIQKQNIECKATMIFASKKGDIDIKEIEDYIYKEELGHVITIQFNVSRNDLVILYKSIDLLICTSINETFGMIIAEAMMCGTMVISTNNGGVNDIINHEINGYITNVKDYEAITHYAIKYCNKEIHFKPEFLRNTIINKFGRKAFKSRMDNLYNQIIAR
ncbi:glycosyltransferase [Gelidibacter sp. F2691]|nr:glycosyltransferase [Gelidibacter sp. F2691]